MKKYLIRTAFIAGDHKLDYSFIANGDITNVEIFDSVYSFLLTVFGINNVHGGAHIVDSTILRPEYTELIPLIDGYRMSAKEFPVAIAATNGAWNNHIVLENEHMNVKCEINTTELQM